MDQLITIKRDEQVLTVLVLNEDLNNERTILSFLVRGLLCEAEVVEFLLRAVKPGDFVVDVGANIGYYTTILSNLVGPSGVVLAFEPGINCLDRLHANIARNENNNVRLIEKPVSDAPREVMLWLNQHDCGCNALFDVDFFFSGKQAPNQTVAKLQAVTLLDVLNEQKLSVPRIVKIDVEGSEPAVLKGIEPLLEQHAIPFFVIEANEGTLSGMGSSSQELREYLFGFGYKTWLLNPDGKLPKYLPPGTQLRARFVSNLLFASDSDVAEIWPEEFFDVQEEKTSKGTYFEAPGGSS